MKTQIDLSQLLNLQFEACSAFVLYRSTDLEKIHVESYTLDEAGGLINPHPLSIDESNELSEILDCSENFNQQFLVSKGLMPNNILYVNSKRNGFAVWYTPSMSAKLYFNSSLKIKSGEANLPPLIWKASKNELVIWALSKNEKPSINTSLYKAPFFNIFHDGKVCMGGVKIEINKDHSLEEFIESWQKYFFNSYFSHLIISQSPVNMNIVQLWQDLVGTKKAFPKNVLIKSRFKIKDLLS